jgi:uncharacterized protein (DUF58 family)
MRHFLFKNFNLIFRLDRWIRRSFTKAGLLILGSLIAAATFGIDTRQNVAYQLFALLFALLFLAFISSWFIRVRLTARRELPEIATVGESIQYRVHVQNNSQKLQHNLTLRDYLKQPLPTFEEFLQAKEPRKKRRNWFDHYVGYHRWRWLMNLNRGAMIKEENLPAIPPFASISATITLQPLRRGYIYFSNMNFACPDPFGLFNFLYKIKLSDRLLILPKRYPVGEISLFGSRKYQRGGVQLAMSIGEAEEFVALREYRPGDPLRHIHWKSWAKLGKPIVKEFQDEFFVRHALILDTFTENAHGELFEAAVSVASSFASAPHSEEILLDLMFIGTQAYCFNSGRGLAHTDQLLEILACVEACTDKPFESLYPLIREHTASLSGSVCILLNWDESRQKLIKILKQAGIPVLVFIISDTKLEIDQNKFPNVQVLHIDTIAKELALFSIQEKL